MRNCLLLQLDDPLAEMVGTVAEESLLVASL
jgi:hypothetical protein